MIKRVYFLFLELLFVVPVCIAGSDSSVTMVSYEQGWLDRIGTLALKNNSNEEIHSVMFQITYLDMSGKALDYEEFTRSVSIAPGMTKKIDIPAYEYNRHYHYYKSENMPGGSPSFKIEYKLIDYNFTEEAKDDDYDPYRDDGNYEYEAPHPSYYWSWLFAIGAAMLGIGITVGMYVLVSVLAQQRHRNVVVWILLSIVGSPLLMIIILLCIGDSQKDQL